MTHWLDKVFLLLEAPTSDLRELAKLAGGDPRTFYRGIDPNSLDLEGQDISGIDFGVDEFDIVANDNSAFETSAVVATIARTGRQEERIAKILDLILVDRNNGLKVLSLYQGDRARFANIALEQIRSSFLKTSAGNDQFIVAQIVAKLFTTVFPLNKGALLYYLAKHLAKYSVVNSTIEKCLRRSAAQNVDVARSEIIALLEAARAIKR